MTKQVINLGSSPNGAGGDDRRSAWLKAIANFDEIYAALGGNALPAALPIAKGGTGGTTAAAAKAALGIGDIGVGQTWKAVSRSLSTTYTNTTGKPIQVSVFGGPANGGGVGYQVAVDGAVAGIGSYSYASGQYIASQTIIVPPGATYNVSVLNGTAPVLYWRELST
ncbi:hypothetical protein ACNFBR_07310 [Pseudomonas sp. NY11955]|uniref:hypothetical protein n=1 Tax=Pseudomonas sp. NY11955 TaxID=3400363 RepID=UPI003A8833F4